MEVEPCRRQTETVPTYKSFFLEKGAAGALSTGFLPPRYSVVDINPEAAVKGNALDQKAIELLEERWRLFRELKDVEKSRIATYGKAMAGYDDFYDTAHKLLSVTRWPDAVKIAEADRKRYRNNSVGISCILARSVLAPDAGPLYIHVCHTGWCRHVCILYRS